MAQRTLHAMVANVSRKCGGAVPAGEILEALNNQNKMVHSRYPWPWTYGEANVLLQPTYTIGTVSITDATAAVTGAGTTWDVSWKYKRLYFGASNMDHLVLSFGGVGTATLVQPIDVGSNVVNSGYTIYQDLYPLPSDCEFGNIIVVANPLYRYRLRYLPRYTLESTAIYSKMFFNNYQTGFADGGYDEANKTNLIKFVPAPSTAAELRLVYRRRPPDLTTMASVSELPESFDDMLEFLAEYEVKRYRRLPGWTEAKHEGFQRMKSMRKRVVTSMTDNYNRVKAWPESQPPSIYADGMFIDPVP